MTRMIDADDVIDAGEIATMLGLSHSNTVSLYQRRYPRHAPTRHRYGARTLQALVALRDRRMVTSQKQAGEMPPRLR
jgi:succinate dehydrogenase/fumarate reductase flavoprotein subunit